MVGLQSIFIPLYQIIFVKSTVFHRFFGVFEIFTNTMVMLLYEHSQQDKKYSATGFSAAECWVLLGAFSRFYSGRTVYSMPPLASWQLTTL